VEDLPADLVNEKTPEPGFEEVDQGNETIEASLVPGISDTNAVENLSEIVCFKDVSGRTRSLVIRGPYQSEKFQRIGRRYHSRDR